MGFLSGAFCLRVTSMEEFNAVMQEYPCLFSYEIEKSHLSSPSIHPCTLFIRHQLQQQRSGVFNATVKLSSYILMTHSCMVGPTIQPLLIGWHSVTIDTNLLWSWQLFEDLWQLLERCHWPAPTQHFQAPHPQARLRWLCNILWDSKSLSLGQ